MVRLHVHVATFLKSKVDRKRGECPDEKAHENPGISSRT